MKSKITFLVAFFFFLNIAVAQVKTVSESQLTLVKSKRFNRRFSMKVEL